MKYIKHMQQLFDVKFNFHEGMQILKLLFLLIVAFAGLPLYAQDGIIEAELKNHSTIIDKVERDLKQNLYNEQKLPEVVKQITPIKDE